MTDAEIIERVQNALEVDSRAELEHVLTCDDCYLFDPCDGGAPHYCLEFRKTFRGFVPSPPPEFSYVPTLWAQELLNAARKPFPSGPGTAAQGEPSGRP